MNVKILVLLTALMLVLAACTGAPAATQEPGVGVTGPTEAAGGAGTEAGGASPTTAAGGGAGAAGTCVSVPDQQAFVTAGQGVYEANCAGCHGAQGEGSGNFPALTNVGEAAMADPIGLVTEYFAVDAHPKTLTADDVAAVLSFSSTSFGNSTAIVCPDQVLENMPAQ